VQIRHRKVRHKGYEIRSMKKFLRGLAVLVVALFSTPFILYAVLSAASFAAFYISLAETNTDACTRYYTGVSKGTIWSHGEWHHYVDFKVEDPSFENWEMVEAPLPSSIWKGSPSPDTIRASYRWPSNWQDPFLVSTWKICLLDS
jgi:hypothetical protein